MRMSIYLSTEIELVDLDDFSFLKWGYYRFVPFDKPKWFKRVPSTIKNSIQQFRYSNFTILSLNGSISVESISQFGFCAFRVHFERVCFMVTSVSARRSPFKFYKEPLEDLNKI